MKLIFLIDSEKTDIFEEMLDTIENKRNVIIDTSECSEDNEYRNLSNAIREFRNSDKEILMVNFSGRNNVLRELGDEYSEMIVALSSNRQSGFYSASPLVIFSETIKMFEEEDNRRLEQLILKA